MQTSTNTSTNQPEIVIENVLLYIFIYFKPHTFLMWYNLLKYVQTKSSVVVLFIGMASKIKKK